MLTKDNPAQQSIVASLAPLVQQQIAFLRTSAAMKDKGGSIQLQQEFSASGEDLSRQALTDLQALRAEEQKVGGLRTIISEKTYATQKLVLSISFVVVLLFTILNFVGLMIQLRKRQNAEQVVRRLSGRILQVQDEERRKLSRDLHDGIGQLFAALKMELSQATRSNSLTPRDTKILCDCLELVDEGVNHSRTLSYLLHPPMLDEIGFCAAARWLVQGFSQRSKIAVTFTAPEDLNLPKELELTLFRVLQEGLTNVHRHSGTSTAEVVVSTTQREVALTISDYGKGIPASTLENFKSNKAPTGVGLAGMRGRVADVEGKLELESPGVGTVLRVTIPFEKISQPPTAGGSPTRTVHHVPTEPPLEQRARTSAGLGASNKPS